MVRVGRPITGRLAVRFQKKKIGETDSWRGVSPYACACACACACSTGAYLDGLKEEEKFCVCMKTNLILIIGTEPLILYFCGILRCKQCNGPVGYFNYNKMSVSCFFCFNQIVAC